MGKGDRDGSSCDVALKMVACGGRYERRKPAVERETLLCRERKLRHGERERSSGSSHLLSCPWRRRIVRDGEVCFVPHLLVHHVEGGGGLSAWIILATHEGAGIILVAHHLCLFWRISHATSFPFDETSKRRKNIKLLLIKKSRKTRFFCGTNTNYIYLFLYQMTQN